MTRQAISDFAASLLGAEVVNRCPLCGAFEGSGSAAFTNHHINGDPSVSEYWNLLRVCRECHDAQNPQDGGQLRKVKQVKRDLFRRLVGDASFQVLLMANKYDVTSTLPCLASTLLKLRLLQVENPNPFTVGGAKHATLMDFRIADQGRKFIRELGIDPELPL